MKKKNPYLQERPVTKGTIVRGGWPEDTDTHDRLEMLRMAQVLIWAIREDDQLRDALRIVLGIDDEPEDA